MDFGSFRPDPEHLSLLLVAAMLFTGCKKHAPVAPPAQQSHAARPTTNPTRLRIADGTFPWPPLTTLQFNIRPGTEGADSAAVIVDGRRCDDWFKIASWAKSNRNEALFEQATAKLDRCGLTVMPMYIAVAHMDLAKDQMRNLGASAVPAILQRMRRHDGIVEYASTLGRIGQPAAEALAAELGNPDGGNRYAAVYAFSVDDRLARWGAAALPKIEAGYSKDSAQLQIHDVQAVIRIGKVAGKTDTSFLINVTTDDNAMANAIARSAMGVSGPLLTDSESTLASIEAMDLRKEDRAFVRTLRDSRELYFHTIEDRDRYASLRVRYKPDVDQLIAFLANHNSSIRLAAARKLQRYGFLAVDAAVPLARLATDQSRSPVSESVELWLALREVGPGGVRILLGHLTDANPGERLLIAQALEAYGQGASEAVPLLMTRLDANEPEAIDATMIRTLGSIGPYASAALPALYRISSGSDAERAHLAKTVIERIKNDPFRLTPSGEPLPPVTMETPSAKNP